MKNLFIRFAKEESGATAIEYALIAALIGTSIVVATTALGGEIAGLFAQITGVLAGV